MMEKARQYKYRIIRERDAYGKHGLLGLYEIYCQRGKLRTTPYFPYIQASTRQEIIERLEAMLRDARECPIADMKNVLNETCKEGDGLDYVGDWSLGSEEE